MNKKELLNEINKTHMDVLLNFDEVYPLIVEQLKEGGVIRKNRAD